MIDLHSHILPALDDGAESMSISVEMALSACADGIRTVAVTPHVRSDYPTTPARMEEGLVALRAALVEARVPLEVLPGGEISLDMIPSLDDSALRRFGLGGNPACLLIEMPYSGWPLALEETLFQLRVRGFSTVLAHPERNDDVQAAPGRLQLIVDSGTLVQLTAASLDGRMGSRAQQTGHRLLELGLAHLLASDAHAPTLRQIGMSAAIDAIGDRSLAQWLTETVPRAIVKGTPLPDRPRPATRRLSLRVRRR